MAWTSVTYITGQLVTQVEMNKLRDNLNELAIHTHGNGEGSGDGGSLLLGETPWVDMRSAGPTAADSTITAMIAPGTSGNRILWWDGGSGGAEYTIDNATHAHGAQGWPL